ncbi:phage tail sheath C-terminal domain-containing protein [Tahibacter caeni]|uniref:phage tail sheath C-terminal domain-containing protein n=1 Tax=Tahibacter caeni TaxID=1453545 RepID=UPI0021488D67|nr:phage tail sheath C-terminal domain-containing protein [Tahibacter caeni]
MVQLSYPGVYINEVSSGVRTITGVATSIAAFVGFTRKGALDKAVSVTSFADYERLYGGLDRDSPVSYAVRQFFMNGGTQAFVVRVVKDPLAASLTLNDAAIPVLTVEASSAGSWGDALRISIQHTGVRNPDGDFNLVVSQLQPDGAIATLETHRNLTMNPESPQFVKAVVNAASTQIRVDTVGSPAYPAGLAISGAPAFPLAAAADGIIAGTVDGQFPFSLLLPTVGWADMATLVAAVDAAITAAGVASHLAVFESDADGVAGAGGHLTLQSQHTGAQSSVFVATGALGGLARTLALGVANGGREIPGAAEHRPAVVANAVPSSLGSDGTRGGFAELAGSPSAKTGFYALLDVDLFNILCIPETFDMPDSPQSKGLIAAADVFCAERRAFYIIDPPSSLTALPDVVTWANVSVSKNAATYFPAPRISDPLDGGRLRSVAPSGTLAGVYARTDATRGVWKAPAGTDATLNGVLELARPVNDIENGQLNPHGINVLRSFPVYGRVAWGARTRNGDDAQGSEYKYIPIRRLALFLEESLYRGTQWVVFEPNDEPLWAQIRLNLGAFMNGLFRQGAFQGKTPQEAYFVKCDKETTTQADRNLGIVNILVGFAPLKPAEFVVLTIQQIAGDLR